MKENQELKERLKLINTIIRKKLYSTRKDKGFGQKEFGNNIGVSGRTVKYLEFCPKKLYAAMLFVLCKELKIDVHELVENIYSVIDI